MLFIHLPIQPTAVCYIVVVDNRTRAYGLDDFGHLSDKSKTVFPPLIKFSFILPLSYSSPFHLFETLDSICEFSGLEKKYGPLMKHKSPVYQPDFLKSVRPRKILPLGHSELIALQASNAIVVNSSRRNGEADEGPNGK